MALADAVPFATAVYPLDEASGSAIDSVGSLDLTERGTVGSGTGKVTGNARDFEQGEGDSFDHADNAAFSPADELFTVRVWLNVESYTATRTIVCKGSDLGSAATTNWSLLILGDGTLRWAVSDGATFTTVSWGTPLSTGTWYLVHAWHDPTANQIGIAVNAGTAVTTSYSTGLIDGTGLFRVGDDGATRNYDGLLNDLVLLKGYALDATERTEDYNGGTGVAFADWAGGSAASVGIPATVLGWT